MNYIFQRVEHSKVVRGADGKYAGAKSVFTQETDKDGNLKEVAHEEYNLNDKGEWETVHDGGGMYVKDAKMSEDGKHAIVTVTDEKPNQKFKDGDILKVELGDHNAYVAYYDDENAYWVLFSSAFPGFNEFYHMSERGQLVSLEEVGVGIDDLVKAPREEVFAVEHFITANFGYRWDWKKKELVKA